MPKNLGDNKVFEEDFYSTQLVLDNGGVINGAPSIDSGIVLDGVSDYVQYEPKDIRYWPKGTVRMDLVAIEDSGTIDYIYTISKRDGVTQTNLAFYLDFGSLNRFTISCKVNGSVVWTYNGATNHLDALVGGDLIIHVTHDGVAAKVYFNGVEDTAGSFAVTTDKTIWFADLFSATTAADIIAIGALKNNSGIQNPYQGTIKGVTVYSSEFTDDEVLDDYEADTYQELDANNALVYLEGRTRFNDGTNEVTKNLGSLENVLEGDGSTSSTYPAILNHKGFDFGGGDYLRSLSKEVLDVNGDYIFHTRISHGAYINKYIFDWRGSGSGGIGCYMDASGGITAFIHGAGFYTLGTPESYDDNVERDLTVVWKNTSPTTTLLTIYIDGVEVISASTGIPNAATEYLHFGDYYGLAQGMVGGLKDVGVWNIAATPRQVRYLNENSLKNLHV